MKTLNEEIARIKSAVADISSKAFTGKALLEKYNEITLAEYEACEKIWSDLYGERRRLTEELNRVNREIEAVEIIMIRPIKEDK